MKCSFLDRVVADSHSIGLYHTSGLEHPEPGDHGHACAEPFVLRSGRPLYQAGKRYGTRPVYGADERPLGLPADDSAQNARYYTLVDVLAIASARYGEDFADWLKDSRI